MKLIRTLLLLTFSFSIWGCATDANGHRVYSGPSVGATIGYNGISFGLSLSGPVALPVGVPVQLPKPSGK